MAASVNASTSTAVAAQGMSDALSAIQEGLKVLTSGSYETKFCLGSAEDCSSGTDLKTIAGEIALSTEATCLGETASLVADVDTVTLGAIMYLATAGFGDGKIGDDILDVLKAIDAAGIGLQNVVVGVNLAPVQPVGLGATSIELTASGSPYMGSSGGTNKLENLFNLIVNGAMSEFMMECSAKITLPMMTFITECKISTKPFAPTSFFEFSTECGASCATLPATGPGLVLK